MVGIRWDADLQLVKAERFKMYALLGLDPPAVTTTKEASKREPKKEVADEHATYASLVDTFGY
jgi:hypothetical protein